MGRVNDEQCLAILILLIMLELKVKNGTYKEDNLITLLWVVFCHRFHHWKKGEGFVD